MKIGPQPGKWLSKKAKVGFRGYPVGTVAFYGPDNRRASKAVVSVLTAPDSDPAALRRWFSDTGDVRTSRQVSDEMAEFLQEHGARTVVMPDRIIGCPHEEGIDYPAGEPCPQCPYWANRDRWRTDPAQ